MVTHPRRSCGCWISPDRGQTEPLAALVSVAAVCFAVSLYAGTVADILPKTGSDRAVGEPAADSIWQEISEEEIYDSRTDIESALPSSSLPQGYRVAVEVTVVDGPSMATVGSGRFDETGTVAATEPPEGAEVIERPVSVRLPSGEIRPGRLTVEVWK
ncbi:DUF7285 family protein [Halobacteriaceae archaeon SHR40]|uniref:DUF7285 family protein n=1 Tax=Halovenus amylolytica TaxID=2500550 RepID=UPI000FE379C5